MAERLTRALYVRNQDAIFWSKRYLKRIIRRLNNEKWEIVRKEARQLYGDTCMRCGSTKMINVDHIKPKSKYPELFFSLENLQILCWPCNKEKGTTDETDYRRKAA